MSKMGRTSVSNERHADAEKSLESTHDEQQKKEKTGPVDRSMTQDAGSVKLASS